MCIRDRLGSELLSKIEQSGITPWLVNSTPEATKIVIPIHDLSQIEQFICGKIEYRTAIATVVGKFDIDTQHEIISKNEYGTRMIIDSTNLSETLSELYHSLFSLQDCM